VRCADTLPHSCVECLDIFRASISWSLKGLSRPTNGIALCASTFLIEKGNSWIKIFKFYCLGHNLADIVLQSEPKGVTWQRLSRFLSDDSAKGLYLLDLHPSSKLVLLFRWGVPVIFLLIASATSVTLKALPQPNLILRYHRIKLVKKGIPVRIWFHTEFLTKSIEPEWYWMLSK
jgi:hypothetical protein